MSISNYNMYSEQEIEFEDLIDGIFKSEPREPYSIAIDFDLTSIRELFESFLRIFHRGSILLFGDENEKVDLDRLSIEDFINMGRYFKSFGIDIYFKKVPHQQYKDFVAYLYSSSNSYDYTKYEHVLETVDILKYKYQRVKKIDDYRYQIIVKDNLYILYFSYGNYIS